MNLFSILYLFIMMTCHISIIIIKSIIIYIRICINQYWLWTPIKCNLKGIGIRRNMKINSFRRGLIKRKLGRKKIGELLRSQETVNSSTSKILNMKTITSNLSLADVLIVPELIKKCQHPFHIHNHPKNYTNHRRSISF